MGDGQCSSLCTCVMCAAAAACRLPVVGLHGGSSRRWQQQHENKHFRLQSYKLFNSLAACFQMSPNISLHCIYVPNGSPTQSTSVLEVCSDLVVTLWVRTTEVTNL